MSIDRAKRVLEIEAKAVADLVSRVGDDFLAALQIILSCEGKVIVVGIGKSGLVGRKIAATLASIGFEPELHNAKTSALSGGQLSRLGLAQVLM